MYNQNFIVDSLQNEKRLILGRARKSRAIHVRVYLKYEKKTAAVIDCINKLIS